MDSSDKTPILLHPAKRLELLRRGQELFNEEKFFEAHEIWEELWHVENGRDKVFVQGLIATAGHLVHVRKGNWSGAKGVAALALDKLYQSPANRLYRELDVEPLTYALTYNVGLLATQHPDRPPPAPDSFIIPRLLEN